MPMGPWRNGGHSTVTTRWRVVLRRANGRLVKYSRWHRSKYAAKAFMRIWDEKYDASYVLELEPEE